ncbi:unnamed protein product [Urochloa humidicola]
MALREPVMPRAQRVIQGPPSGDGVRLGRRWRSRSAAVALPAPHRLRAPRFSWLHPCRSSGSILVTAASNPGVPA